MKKIVLAIVLGCLTITCYATPNWSANSSGCSPHPGDNLTGCFLNKTGKNLSGLNFMATAYYQDGAAQTFLYNLGGTQPNFYSVASVAKTELKKFNITTYILSITEGAKNPHALSGCNIAVSTNSTPIQAVTIVRDNGVLHC